VTGPVVVECPQCGATAARITTAGDGLQISARGWAGLADREPDPGTPARTLREWMADKQAVQEWLADDRDHVVTRPVTAQLPAGPGHHTVNLGCRDAACVVDLWLCTCQVRHRAPRPGQRPSRWCPTADEIATAQACRAAGAALTILRGAIPISLPSADVDAVPPRPVSLPEQRT
jgi:hypothetical protein